MGSSNSSAIARVTNTNENALPNMIDKDNGTINEQFIRIIKQEIAYYRSLMGNSQNSWEDVVYGLLYDKVFEIPERWEYGGRRTPQESNPSLDPTKKEEFINNTLPQWIEEYQVFMLNLVNKYTKSSNSSKGKKSISFNQFLSTLIPLPVSIQFLWRCHLLHPKSYYDDCMKYFGFLLSPQLEDDHMIISCQEQNKKLAVQQYMVMFHGSGGRYFTKGSLAEDGFISFRKKYSIKKTSTKMRFTDLDFGVTAIKQLEFMSKISCRAWEQNFNDNIQKFGKRYVKYLKTCAELIINKDSKFEYDSLSPTYNIDFIWHLMMLFPNAYRRECAEITNGLILDHDDSDEIGNEFKNKNEDKDKDKDQVDNKDVDSYWKYGRLGQFNTRSYVEIVKKEEAKILVNGYLRNCDDNLPNDIFNLVFVTYFDVDEELEEMKKSSPSPPPVIQDLHGCKGIRMCCVGDHIKISSQ